MYRLSWTHRACMDYSMCIVSEHNHILLSIFIGFRGVCLVLSRASTSNKIDEDNWQKKLTGCLESLLFFFRGNSSLLHGRFPRQVSPTWNSNFYMLLFCTCLLLVDVLLDALVVVWIALGAFASFYIFNSNTRCWPFRFLVFHKIIITTS